MLTYLVGLVIGPSSFGGGGGDGIILLWRAETASRGHIPIPIGALCIHILSKMDTSCITSNAMIKVKIIFISIS